MKLPYEVSGWRIVPEDPYDPNCVIFNLVPKYTTMEKVEINFTIQAKEEIEFEF